MFFSFFDVLILIGITQGLVATLLLLFSREKKINHVLLALAILSLCLLFFKILLAFTGLAREVPFRYLPNAFELATAPLFYFYLVALVEKDFSWQSKYWVHFIPFAMAQLYAFYIFGSVLGLPTAALQDAIAHQRYYVLFKEIEDWMIVVSILSYLGLGYRKYSAFQQQVKNNTADTAYPTLNWLRNILLLSILLLVFLVINMTTSRLTQVDAYTDWHWKLYFIYVAAVTYYLGFMAYRQQAPDLEQVYPSKLSSDTAKVASEELEPLADRLRHLLAIEKIYLDPSLNARQVAERLAINPTHLSQMINSQFNKSFRELINDYRIEEVKAKLLEQDSKASVLSLALESGFNSEASFYRVFKKSTGLTPKAFIREHAVL